MRFLTAGESHGKGLVAILDGFPSNLILNIDALNHELSRRQQGYGRGGRMKIETDKLDIYSGVRNKNTLGSPISFIIHNADYKNWEHIMGADCADTSLKKLTRVRPGHADLSGCIKYQTDDARNILERASARETAARVGVGAFCKQLLEFVGITIGSYVSRIGGAVCEVSADSAIGLNQQSDLSRMRTLNENSEINMISEVDKCIGSGDTVGGELVVIATGVPIGVGSHAQYDRKLDFMLSSHLGGIQAVKSISFGAGERFGNVFGSKIHDEIGLTDDGKILRKTNNAGGIEGGISNGESIIARLTVKPIPTLMKGLDTVDISDMSEKQAAPERSDYCAVPAAGVVAEAVMAFVIADALLSVTGGDTADEVKARVEYMRQKSIVHG